MSDVQEQIKALRATRADYAEEACWHKFLIDAAYGTGGFRGRCGPTEISELGWAAEAYAQITAASVPFGINQPSNSYLDQFAREDSEKFQRRIQVAHYKNYVGPIHDILISYLNKADSNYEAIPKAVADWQEGVDLKGTPWSDWIRDSVRPRASLLGWLPVMFDVVGEDVDAPVSKAQEKLLGRAVRAIPLLPINVLDWYADDEGKVVAAKICVSRVRRDGLLGAKVHEETFSLWYADRVETYVVTTRGDEDPVLERLDDRVHGMGCVPIVVFRVKATQDDSVRGVSSIADLAVIARRLFNLESEMDDFIRGQVFATLGIPVEDPKTPIGELIGGNGSAIKVPMQSNMPLHYVAPPASVGESLEKRLEVTVREIYRIANIEYATPTGAKSASGVARGYEFEPTNKRLSGMAGNFARDEQEALRLVGRILRAPDAESVTVTAPTDFSVEDPAVEIKSALDALQLGLGGTAERELKSRLITRMLPNLPTDTRETIESELDDMRDQSEADKAMAREVARSKLTEGGDSDGESDQSEVVDGDNSESE
jgi:hypothetical protein